MKKIFTTAFLLIGIIIQSNAQITDVNSIPKVAQGITAPIYYPNNNSPLRQTVCDNPDVRVFPSPQPQSEIHLSINKQNPQVLLLSSNTFPFAPGGGIATSGQGAYWSTNGGLNWTGADVLPNGAFGRADPSTAFDAAGNGYIATLNAPSLFDEGNGYLIQRTNNNGATWQPQVQGTGIINGTDKEMIAADDMPTSPFANNLYCSWSVNPGTNGIVQFNRTTNQGTTFSAPVTLRNGWGQGTNVQTGPNGEVYVCWAEYNGSFPEKGLGFVRSTDGGQNFTAFSMVFNYTGIRQTNAGNPDFGNTRVNSYPSMAVDKSNGTHRGRIYVVYAERENGNGRAIISCRFSDNNGTNWTNATTISIPNGRQSWFPWIAVDNTNGDIFITYYSLDEATGFNTNTYVASSNDGGATFVNQRVSDANHVNAPIAEFGGGYAGDYIGITAHSGRAFAAWMDNRSGQWQNYVSEVRAADIELTGNPVLCNTNTYTLTGVPAGATVNWPPPTPAGIVSMNASGNTANLTQTGNGIVTLSAEVVDNGCSYGLFTIQIQVGVPLPPTIVGLNYDRFCGTYVEAGSTHPAGATNYIWSLNFGQVTGEGDYFWRSPLVYNPRVGFTYYNYISVQAQNACGLSYPSATRSLTVGPVPTRCGGGMRLMLSPNPTTSTLTVQTTDKSEFTKLRIINKMGQVKKQVNYAPSKKVTLNVADLPADVYRIQAFINNNWTTVSFIKQ